MRLRNRERFHLKKTDWLFVRTGLMIGHFHLYAASSSKFFGRGALELWHWEEAMQLRLPCFNFSKGKKLQGAMSN